MRAPVVQVEGLTKVFNGLTAVDDLTFTVDRSEILGLLGPNGAGKTTTIQLLLGLTLPTHGRIRIFGLEMPHHRYQILPRVNFSSTDVSLPSNLTVWENLNVFALLYGIRRPRKKILELLELFEIPEVIKRKTGTLSSGQQTRLNLCKAFLNDPELLLLDEPTASLDPSIAAKVRATLKRVQRERGVTMIYTSHNMREIEIMCDRVIFLARGRIVAEGTPQEIMDRARSRSLEDVFITIARDGEIREIADAGGP